MKFLLIYSHPYNESYNHAIYKTIETALSHTGHVLDVIDLVADGFNPTMTPDDLRLYREGTFHDPLVGKYQQMIKDADILVFTFPIWWGVMPAVLKGFIDKVFLKKFAFDYINGKQVGLITKKAVVISTVDSSKEEYETVWGNPIEHQFIKGTLGYCGADVIQHFKIYKVRGGGLEYREEWLERISNYFENL